MSRDLQSYTIDPAQLYGQHISLTCVHHPNLRWHTKNIDFIGARSIFFAGDITRPDVPSWEVHECPCPGSDLTVVKVDDRHGGPTTAEPSTAEGTTVQCIARNPNAGGRCQRQSTPNGTLCPMHAGWTP